jgi:hypothetical protein
MSESIWIDIYQNVGLKDVSIAVNLCERELTSAQITWILANEKRTKAAIAMLLSNNFNEVQLESILQAKYPKEFYAKMLECVSNEKFQAKIHELAGPREYLYYLIRGNDRNLHNEDIFDCSLIKNILLEAISILKPSRKLSSVLNFAIERYPFIATEMCEHTSITLRAQIASYTKIDHTVALKIFTTSMQSIDKNSDEMYPLFALIANPSTPLESLKYIETLINNNELRVRVIESIAKKSASIEEQQKQRIRRASPSEYRPQGRPFELLNLLQETKHTDIYAKVVEALKNLPTNDLPISELKVLAPELIPVELVIPYTTSEQQSTTNPIFTEPSSIRSQSLRY